MRCELVLKRDDDSALALIQVMAKLGQVIRNWSDGVFLMSNILVHQPILR